ncbi:purine and uridine phosphorylase [Aspergillus sclerotiicarbonarius CBS 121057]|uniref:Purine and uridine phosphorylase n=1 Tax=Aspergillus sclerotiicarbonarius (strain CBS 121057 / IBT 28362) TaxID=1448318 RepID=A0A319FAV0_ASPSB|nr:purine and uridine phosphorylase [Aspergillus sclerotiicarbonarius CBS 121057]
MGGVVSRTWLKATKPSYPDPPRHEAFQIAIICSRASDVVTVKTLFDEQFDYAGYPDRNLSDDSNLYIAGRIGSHNVLVTHAPRVGKVIAAKVAMNLRRKYHHIKLALVVGVCGGRPVREDGNIWLGDVLVSEGLVQYDLGRKIPGGYVHKDGPKDSLPRPTGEAASFVARLGAPEQRHRLEASASRNLVALQQAPGTDIPHYPGQKSDVLFAPTHRHGYCGRGSMEENPKVSYRGSRPIQTTCEQFQCALDESQINRRRSQSSDIPPQPHIHFGMIASGDALLTTGEARDGIDLKESVIGFDMEGTSLGVWTAFPSCIVIKGVCHYADGHYSEDWRNYAVATAAATAKTVLSEYVICDEPDSMPNNDMAMSAFGKRWSLRFFECFCSRYSLQNPPQASVAIYAQRTLTVN